MDEYVIDAEGKKRKARKVVCDGCGIEFLKDQRTIGNNILDKVSGVTPLTLRNKATRAANIFLTDWGNQGILYTVVLSVLTASDTHASGARGRGNNGKRT